ncbi:hypothetical protein BC748_2491 [Flavobacterium dankookense]|uniref:Uncharacterized protein n=1 Tax=Flavobacterium dankookense TaxID=706186 RepID=A0A4R6Q9T9_9FLAO|nr:hypothetical protein BC748_2491 [Flavobacterium dankookense]
MVLLKTIIVLIQYTIVKITTNIAKTKSQLVIL